MTTFNGYTFTNLSGGDTESNPDSFTNPSNAFDDNDATDATLNFSATGSQDNKTLGTTFSAATIVVARVKADLDMGLGASSYSAVIKLQGFDGSSWFDLFTLATGTTQTLSYDGLIRMNSSVQGMRVKFETTTDSAQSVDLTLSTLSYGTSFTYTPKMLLENLGGNNIEDLGDKTAISEDHTLTWNTMLNLSGIGISQNAYQTLQANDVFENKDFLAAEEFTDSTGTNDTVNDSATDAFFDTNLYKLGSAAPYTSGKVVVCNKNTLTLDGTEKSLCVYADKTLPTDTSITYDVSDNEFSATGGDTVNTYGYAEDSTPSTAARAGIRITMKRDSFLKSVTKAANSTATIAYLADDSDNVIESASFSGNTATFAGTSLMEDDIIYRIVADDGGSTYTASEDGAVSFPLTSTDFDVTQGINVGGSPSNTSMVNIDSVTTQDAELVYSVTNQSLNEVIDITSLDSGTLAIKFNLITTDTNNTPELKGYGVYLFK